jgi:hypothetical protein
MMLLDLHLNWEVIRLKEGLRIMIASENGSGSRRLIVVSLWK